MAMLAMHMANELLSLPVVAVTLAIAAAAGAGAIYMAKRSLDPAKLPLMGVMGAFVFAAQMINFTLPGMPGTSGHLVGAVLLAILLGPWCAMVTMAAILIVQCLLFQDGGLLALGCNYINMGIVPCLAGFGIYRWVLGAPGRAGAMRQYLAAWAACVVSVAGAAALVPLEAGASGVLRIPAASFLTLMVGVHLVIGLIEGLITFAVLAYLRRAGAFEANPALSATGTPVRPAVIASLLATALLLAGVVSWFASSAPDGLEWSLTGHTYAAVDKAVENQSPAVAAVNAVQSQYTPLPDYSKREASLGQALPEKSQRPPSAWPNVDGWGSLSGLAGTAVTLLLVYLAARVLRVRNRNKPSPALASESA